MALSILVQLRHQSYDTLLRGSMAEWPSPARLFCALAASAREDADWAALRWLEQTGDPEVHMSPTAEVSRATGYVVTNGMGEGSQFRPGHGNGHKERTAVLAADHSFAVVWPDAVPDDATLGRLVRLAHRLPFAGGSTSSAEVSVVPDVVDGRDAWTTFRPVDPGTEQAVELPVPYPGYTDLLRDAHEAGRPHEPQRLVAYLPLDAQPSETPPPSPVRPYPRMVILRASRPSMPVSGDRVLQVTEALRQAVMSRMPDPIPPQVSGHESDTAPHVAYLGLLDVGHRHADGHLLGVAVACPAEMPSDDQQALVRTLVRGLKELRIDRRTTLRLEYDAERTHPWGLLPERWTSRGGATTWASVTPVMLDRNPRRSLTAEDVLVRSFLTAGYPEPVGVKILPSPPLKGGVCRPHARTIPAGRPRRPLVHCRVEFPYRVVGPVIAGSLRYLGFGLLVPEEAPAADSG